MDLEQGLLWLFTGDARLITAAIVVLLMFAIKSIPWVEKTLLTTPQRRLIATGVLALGPAVTVLVSGADIKTVVVTALMVFLPAIGIHTTGKVSQGKPVGVADNTPSGRAVFVDKEGNKLTVGPEGMTMEVKKGEATPQEIVDAGIESKKVDS